MTKRKRRQFTAEFKADAVRLVRAGGQSIAQIARNLDLAETALREWVRLADIEAGEGPPGALTQTDRSERRHSTLDYFSPIEYELRYMVLQQST